MFRILGILLFVFSFSQGYCAAAALTEGQKRAATLRLLGHYGINPGLLEGDACPATLASLELPTDLFDKPVVATTVDDDEAAAIALSLKLEEDRAEKARREAASLALAQRLKEEAEAAAGLEASLELAKKLAAQEEAAARSGRGHGRAESAAATAAHEPKPHETALLKLDKSIVTFVKAAAGDGQNVHAFNTGYLRGNLPHINKFLKDLGIAANPGLVASTITPLATDKVFTKDNDTTETRMGADFETYRGYIIAMLKRTGTSPELGISIPHALSLAFQIAQHCDAIRGGSTFTDFFFDMVAQNITEAGGCDDGIVGRAMMVCVRSAVWLIQQQYDIERPAE